MYTIFVVQNLLTHLLTYLLINVIHKSLIRLTEIERLLYSATFTTKFELVFCLNTGKRFVFRGFILNPRERA